MAPAPPPVTTRGTRETWESDDPFASGLPRKPVTERERERERRYIDKGNSSSLADDTKLEQDRSIRAVGKFYWKIHRDKVEKMTKMTIDG